MMKSLKLLTNKFSYNSIFNSIYKNFLKHDFKSSSISNISVFFLEKYEVIKSSKINNTDPEDHLLVFRDDGGIFQIGVFNSESKEICRNDINIEYLASLNIINRHKLSEKNLISFVFWELFKNNIECEEAE